MKFKLLDRILMLSKHTLMGVLVQCLLLNVIWAADMNSMTDENEVMQGVTVTGKVSSSEDNEGLPGANVIVKGTSTGTVTDVEGNYSLEVPDGNATIVYSSVGYTTAEIVVGSRSTIDITLNVDVTSLDEIVVVGYGEQKKATVTGAVSSVDVSIFIFYRHYVPLTKYRVFNITNYKLISNDFSLNTINRNFYIKIIIYISVTYEKK